jgi:hypothetical protein
MNRIRRTVPRASAAFRASPAEWHVITGTARGRLHEVRGTPSEDAVAHLTTADGIVVAIADGHGHQRHFRSAAGAALAVEVACEAASGLASVLAADFAASPGQAADDLRERLPRQIHDGWRAAVARHVAEAPFTAAEADALTEGADGPEVPYGSTLLVAVITAGWLVCAQIGDGDMVAVAPDGGHDCPVPGDARLDGLHTTSLCQADALAAFRTGMRDLATQPPGALLLATDGFGNAQAADPWQPAVARDLATLAARQDPGWFAGQVPRWAGACASRQGSGDDTTIALMMRAGPWRA